MPDLIPRAHLFGAPVRASFRISPDGAQLSWLAPDAGVLNLWVGPVDEPERGRFVTADRGRGIQFYTWAQDGRHLLYLQDAGGDENQHVYAVDSRDGTVRDLTPFPGVAAAIIRISRTITDRVLIALNDRDLRFHDLYSVEIATGARTLIQENPGFLGFVTDRHYGVHLASRNAPDGSQEVLRRDGPDWIPWLTLPAEDARGSGPDRVNAAGTDLFLYDSRGRDTAALVRVDLATGARTVLAAHDEADIGGVLYDIETEEPLAYAVTHARQRWHVLDARVRDDIAFLDGQNLGDWYVVDRTRDDRIWLVVGDADTRSGVTGLYDRRARTLRRLGSARPLLDAAPLAPMRATVIRSRDGLDLVSYLSRPLGADGPGPLVLLVHGGPWGRDAFGFNAEHQWLANRGYAALSVNFRASLGFGKAFVNAGDREWGGRMDDDLLDAVAWAVAEGIADPARVGIMGTSYGGYATLAALARNPDTYACGIDVVGPANLETLLRTVPPYWEAFRAQLIRAIGDPDTAEGLDLMRARSPVHRAGRIRAPLLIAQGANDPRVKQAESDQMVAALDANGIPVTYLLFPDEGHGFVRPVNRLAFYARAEAFLARHLGGRAEPPDPAAEAGHSLRVVRDS
ncbi:S9 family peptidase [Methylobacterium sp. NMS12]|uniref:S9 family peptidase n=1 Tax=Methylobacterium sp. NMS12 TaxID=3079766 RepID=UPI003F88170C